MDSAIEAEAVALRASGAFDDGWYLRQYPDVKLLGMNPAEHFVWLGQKLGRQPSSRCATSSQHREILATGLFDSAWYASQYPDVLEAGTDPLSHYLQFGASQGRSPSPLFDAPFYIAAVGQSLDHADALLHFHASGRDVAPGAYRNSDVLTAMQRDYLAGFRTSLVRHAGRQKRRFAVYLQCGSGSIHQEWLSSRPRNWDLFVSHYDDAWLGKIGCEVEVQPIGALPGTKFTSFFSVFRDQRELVLDYEYVLLLDDDILIGVDAISELFEIAAQGRLDLAQASLTPDSYFAHPVTANQSTDQIRHVNTVEIMMPVISRRALEVGGYLFGLSISGWGVDLVLGQLVAAQLGGRAGVIDRVQARHGRKIDTQGGSFYRMLHERSIFPELELRHLQRLYGVGRAIDAVVPLSAGAGL